MNNDKIKEEIAKLGEAVNQAVKNLGEYFAESAKDRPQEPEVLRPVDYTEYTSDAWRLDHTGGIGKTYVSKSLFAAFSKKTLEPIAKQLKIMSIIHRLKQSAGCGDYEFIHGEENYRIAFEGVSNFQPHAILVRDSAWKANDIYFPESHKDAIFAGFLECVKRNEI